MVQDKKSKIIVKLFSTFTIYIQNSYGKLHKNSTRAYQLYYQIKEYLQQIFCFPCDCQVIWHFCYPQQLSDFREYRKGLLGRTPWSEIKNFPIYLHCFFPRLILLLVMALTIFSIDENQNIFLSDLIIASFSSFKGLVPYSNTRTISVSYMWHFL